MVSGAQGSCIAGGQETEPSGESLGLVTQPPGPSGSESSTICPGRTGSQAPRVAWALRARMGGGQGSPWRKRLCWKQRLFFGFCFIIASPVPRTVPETQQVLNKLCVTC